MLLRNQADTKKSDESKINKVEEKTDKNSFFLQIGLFKLGLYKKEKDISKALNKIQYAEELKEAKYLSKISKVADFSGACLLYGAILDAYVYHADFSISLLMCGGSLVCFLAGRLLDLASALKRWEVEGEIASDNYFLQLECPQSFIESLSNNNQSIIRSIFVNQDSQEEKENDKNLKMLKLRTR